MSRLLIKNGWIVNASGSLKGDLLVCDGKIKSIGTNLEIANEEIETIDASGFYVLPGGVDAHVHMALSIGNGLFSADDFYSGSRAAIVGGTTTLIDFVTPAPKQSLLEALAIRQKEAANSLCDYGLHMSITYWNKKVAAEMQKCVENEGITSFKVYMAYKDTIGLDDADIINVMDTAARLKARVTIHCEHGEMVSYLQKKLIVRGKTAPRNHPLSRPFEVEHEAVVRALMMAQLTRCPLYIVHVSCKEAVAEIAAAQAEGCDVLAETCPHYLLLDESRYEGPGFESAAFVMSPPLRNRTDCKTLWRALKKGIIQTVATDHCPFNLKGEKEIGRADFSKIPNGVPGVENRMSLLYTYGVLEKEISLPQMVNVASTAPARIFGLYPRKGIICEGADADIVLWDRDARSTISAETHLQKCDTNIYEGFPIKGKPKAVIVNGEVVWEKGIFKTDPQPGRYLMRV